MRRHLRSWLLGLVPTIALLSALPAAAFAAPRLALVVGDAAYRGRPLATAANDAALVAQALAQAGFAVTAAHDLDAASTRAALAAFVDAARHAGPGATIFVYLAGYGVQYDGENYLVPTDARMVHDDDVPKEAVDLGDVGRALAAVPARARLLVYDIARAGAFAMADEMPLAAGLALTIPPSGTLVAFDAAPGMTAPPATLPYGAYARALAEMVGTPGLAPDALFDRVRLRVGELTDGTQVPWDAGNVGAEPLLAAGEDPPAGSGRSIDAIPVDALSPDIAYSAVVARDSLAGYANFLRAFPDDSSSARVRILLAVRREALIFQAALQSGEPRALWTYMRRYPRGPHRFDARRRLAALHAPLEPPPRFDIAIFPDLPPPSEAELKLVEAPREAMRDLPPIPVPPAALLPPADADYYDALPPPAPAPAGLLPIAVTPPSSSDVAAGAGRITQARPGSGSVVTRTEVSQGVAKLILADPAGPIAEITTRDAADGSRTVLETDAKKAVLSRTTTLRSADGPTMVQTGANGGILCAIATRTDPDGARITRVTSGRGEMLAAWRRDRQGIVVAREGAGGDGKVRQPTAPLPPPSLRGQVPPVQAVREPASLPSAKPPTSSAPPKVAPDRKAAEPPEAAATPKTLAAPPEPVPRRPAPTPPISPRLTPSPPQVAPPSATSPVARPSPRQAPGPAEPARDVPRLAPTPPHRPARALPPAPKHESKHAPDPKHAARKPPPSKRAPARAPKRGGPAPHKAASHAGKTGSATAHRKAARH